MKDIGKSIKYYRGQCHMTQKELAEKLRLSPSTVGMYEQNRRMPDVNILRELASIFNISINDILGAPDNTNLMYCSEITNRILNLDKNSSKNIEELKRVEQRALIWCVDAALPTMLAHDIVPDLVASVDAGKDLACFADPRSKEIPVLASSNTRTQFLASNQAPKIWGYDHEQIQMMQKRAGIPEAQVPYYLGVSTAMYASAVELGAKKLILIGQDLAFADSGASHVAGRDESAYPVEKIETEGYYGGTVWSRMDWMEFKKWFEKMMDRYPGVKVINATEGGVHLEGSTQETLKQVCDALPSKKHAFRNRLESADNQIHPEEGMKMEEQMYRCGEDIKQIRQWGYHKTFFEEDYRQIPVMDMVLSYMKIVDAEREERFEKALDFVEDQLQKGGFLA